MASLVAKRLYLVEWIAPLTRKLHFIKQDTARAISMRGGLDFSFES
jgi:hypothetical protein